MVHPVVRGCVEDPLKRTEPVHNLSVNPKLVYEVELTVDHVHRRRNGHTEGDIEHLSTEESSGDTERSYQEVTVEGCAGNHPTQP